MPPEEPRTQGAELLDRWSALWKSAGLKGRCGGIFAEVSHRYAEPHRNYHTLNHINACLAEMDSIPQGRVKDPVAVELALWFHDLVYETRDPLYHENEIRSAVFAESVLEEAGATEELTDQVVEFIRATKHEKLQDPEGDAAFVCDIDLASLGESPVTFDRHTRAIREEYANVPTKEFTAGRIRIMSSFIDTLRRPRIYSTPLFVEQYEEKARANIKRHIEELRREEIFARD